MGFFSELFKPAWEKEGNINDEKSEKIIWVAD